jgi:hypothetical protein
LITLYITPVIYVYLDRLQHWRRSRPTPEIGSGRELPEPEAVWSK